MEADPSYGTKNYIAEGGAMWVVGGTLVIADGGTFIGGPDTGGGTGDGGIEFSGTVAAHGLVVGVDADTIETIAPGSAGQALISNGDTADPGFRPLSHGDISDWASATSGFGTGDGGGGGSSTVPVTTVATSGASQTLAFPTTGSACFDITATAALTLALSGGTTGEMQTITAMIRHDGTDRVITPPTGVKWAGGSAPTLVTASGVVLVVTFTTPDAGTTVIGSY